MTTPDDAKLRAVDDSEREVRIEAIHALGEIGAPAAAALATLDLPPR